MKKLIDKWLGMEPRKAMAVGCVAVFAFCSLFVGGLFGLLGVLLAKNFWGGALVWVKLLVPILGGIPLLLFTKVDEGWAMGIPLGLCWGTAGVAALFDKFGWRIGTEPKYACSFIITALVCYIAYTKRDKLK